MTAYDRGNRGIVFPLALVLLFVLFLLGTTFLSLTLQSKNVSAVYLFDNVAFAIAESAVGEAKMLVSQGVKADPGMMNFVAGFEAGGGPTEGVFPFPLSLATLPVTARIVDNLVGAGKGKIEGKVKLHHVRRERDFPDLPLGNGAKAPLWFQGEFQAILRFDFLLTLTIGTQTRTSRFAYEFDFKHACLRSRGEGRYGRGYPSTETNDYVLFLRDACDEFREKFGEPLNSPQFGIRLEGAGTRMGKVFLGSRDLGNLDNRVFLNLSLALTSLIPPLPSNLDFSWDDLAQLAPKLTSSIEQEIRSRLPPDDVEELEDILQSFTGHLGLDYGPILGESGGWLATAQPWKKQAYFNFFDRCRIAMDRFPQLVPETNWNPLSILFNGQPYDPSVTIEGNVRKRFWGTATWWMTSDYSDDLKQAIEESTLTLIERLLPEELAGKTPEQQEVANMIAGLERQYGQLLTTGPNDLYQFQQRPIKVMDAGIPLPPLYQSRSTEGLNTLRQHPNVFVRSYMFPDTGSFLASPLWELKGGQLFLKLPGAVAVKGFVEIPAGTRYSGKGVLFSYSGIKLGGEFLPATPGDGPCFLMTDGGPIVANVDREGEIDASLIALDFLFPAKISGIYWKPGTNLNVRGNVAADRIYFGEGVGQSPQPAGEARITYDAQRLAGDVGDLYVSFVGGLLRRVGTVMSAQ